MKRRDRSQPWGREEFAQRNMQKVEQFERALARMDRALPPASTPEEIQVSQVLAMLCPCRGSGQIWDTQVVGAGTTVNINICQIHGYRGTEQEYDTAVGTIVHDGFD